MILLRVEISLTLSGKSIDDLIAIKDIPDFVRKGIDSFA